MSVISTAATAAQGLLWVALGVACSRSSSQLPPSPAVAAESIDVNVAERLAPLSTNYKPGIFALTFDRHPDYPYDKYFRDIDGGDFRNSVGLNFVAQRVNLERKLSWLADHFDKVVQDGGHPHLEIGEMPPWLTSCPGFQAPPPAGSDIGQGTCPPTDYDAWADVVEAVVNYMKNVRGLEVTYGIWSGEVEGIHWSDDEDSFFKLYRYSVLGARRADPNAALGVGFLDWESEHYYYPMQGGGLVRSNKGPMLRNFLQYAAQTPLPELGLARLPLDFLEHHGFDRSPHVGYWEYTVQTLRAWLQEFGYSGDTELFFEYSSPESGNGAGSSAASFLAASMLEIAGAGGKIWPMYNDMFPASYDRYWNVGLFNSHFNPTLSRKDYVVRASYNVFRMFTMLRESRGGAVTRVGVVTNAEFIPTVGVVAESGDGSAELRLLVAYDLPVGTSTKHHLKFRFSRMPAMLSTAAARDEIEGMCRGSAALGACVQARIDAISDPVLRARLDTLYRASACLPLADWHECLTQVSAATEDPEVKTDLAATLEEYARVQQLLVTTRHVQVRLHGLPYSGPATLTSYVVDDEHSNACAYNARTGTPNGLCGAGGAIDQLISRGTQEVTAAVAPLSEDERATAAMALGAYGTYTTASGQVLEVSTFLETINDDPNIALEGSRTQIPVDLVKGAAAVSLEMLPHSVHLLVLTPDN